MKSLQGKVRAEGSMPATEWGAELPLNARSANTLFWGHPEEHSMYRYRCRLRCCFAPPSARNLQFGSILSIFPPSPGQFSQFSPDLGQA